jgi:hypothetical protein
MNKLNLQTQVKFDTYPSLVQFSDSFCGLGSCFTQNIGGKLQDAGFRVALNPTGINFSSISMLLSIKQVVEGFNPDLCFKKGDFWFSWLHHSSFFDKSKEELIAIIEQENERFLNALKRAKWILLTPGTAYYYEHVEQGSAVANCHKMPQQIFKKYRLTPAQVQMHLSQIFSYAKQINPTIKVLVTVSPVRHIRDGLHENNLSKSSLLLGVDAFVKEFKSEVFYFPSYEILNDQLRDYRFFANDMAHPSELAVNIIWELFKENIFSAKAKEYAELNEKLQLAQNHTFLHENKAEKEKFEAYKLGLQDRIQSFT